PRRSMGQQVPVALVGFIRITHAGVLPHGPESATIHGGLNSTRVRKFSWIAELPVMIPAFQIGIGTKLPNRNVRGSFRIGRGIADFGPICHVKAISSAVLSRKN